LFLSGDPVMADEITSDTFVSAWLARERIRQPTVKSYLFAIARNLYRDLQRRQERHAEIAPPARWLAFGLPRLQMTTNGPHLAIRSRFHRRAEAYFGQV
jgi:DNA-directed RNA polymerase specialized sigma24 family protein